MEPRMETLQDAARPLRVPPRHELHPHHGREERCGGFGALLRAAQEMVRGAEGNPEKPFKRDQATETLLVCRVVSLECGHRHGELPAQLLHGRSGDRWLRDLSQNRIQRAPQSLRLLLGEHSDTGIRHRPRVVRGTIQRVCQSRCRHGGPSAQLRGPRLEPHRFPLHRSGTEARRTERFHLRARLRRTATGRKIRPEDTRTHHFARRPRPHVY